MGYIGLTYGFFKTQIAPLGFLSFASPATDRMSALSNEELWFICARVTLLFDGVVDHSRVEEPV
jgi:hypothetical protein